MSEFDLPRVELHKPYGIFSAALVIIFHFSDLVFRQIGLGLTELYGLNWKKKLQDEELLPKEFNSRDPQAILKELARNGSSQLRFPLNGKIPRHKIAFFYDGLDDLLGERNAWVHRQLDESLPELKDLAKTTSELLSACSLEFNYNHWIEGLLAIENFPEDKPDSLRLIPTSGFPKEPCQEVALLFPENVDSEIQIGAAVSSRFMTHSYVVETNGDVSDRNTGVKLSEFNSVYQIKLQSMLLDRKVGSRLRLTQDGHLCSFFEDHWGYLATITPLDWFPNHLK